MLSYICLLFYKLLQNNIDGCINNAIQALYSHPKAKIRLIGAYTDCLILTVMLNRKTHPQHCLEFIYIISAKGNLFFLL